ncbi:uncharacterized protein BJ212DRAFT_1483015 [Suillus subaureus]|uniref:Uncharacterized protein n=1 Tax=Suillus subaureus TaxID=48587 RepID=A0A9P7E6V7_9AGAM|nr:uncharacterized protein BJ212DRAFT_1483015 [Suillus subaureus]KAG1812961.1 hypothetical protein BJ212DRAFT_1483015 [Suillus subaureus]
MDNVCNGTVLIVTDSPSSLLSLDSIAFSVDNSHETPLSEEWDLLSEQARDILSSNGGLIQGASWLSYDAIPSLSNTLFSLWRICSSLNTSTSLDPVLPPPRLRQRLDSGFHPHPRNAPLPPLGLMYKEGWEDYALINVPFVFGKLVVADFGAAARSAHDVPPLTPAYWPGCVKGMVGVN